MQNPIDEIAELETKKYINTSVVIRYHSQSHFAEIAHEIGIMSDFKSSVPRTGYNHTVFVWLGSTKLFLTPSEEYLKNVQF